MAEGRTRDFINKVANSVPQIKLKEDEEAIVSEFAKEEALLEDSW